jgi:hypothetical protein
MISNFVDLMPVNLHRNMDHLMFSINHQSTSMTMP